jgi:hypothetical protein
MGSEIEGPPQSLHTDYFGDKTMQSEFCENITEIQKKCGDTETWNVPIVVFVALQDGTNILVWNHEEEGCSDENGNPISQKISLSKGEILILSGFIAHAGAHYKEFNGRIQIAGKSNAHFTSPMSQNFHAFKACYSTSSGYEEGQDEEKKDGEEEEEKKKEEDDENKEERKEDDTNKRTGGALYIPKRLVNEKK